MQEYKKVLNIKLKIKIIYASLKWTWIIYLQIWVDLSKILNLYFRLGLGKNKVYY